MNPEVQEYIDKIKQQDFTNLEVIVLTNLNLSDDEIMPLMQALEDPANASIAGHIRKINLSGNKLTQILLPTSLTRLHTLILSRNQLSKITIPRNLDNLHWLYLENNRLRNIILYENIILGQLNLINNKHLSQTTLTALDALKLRHRMSIRIERDTDAFTTPPLNTNILLKDLPITFKGMISNLDITEQKQYLFAHFKSVINIILTLNTETLKDTNFPPELACKAIHMLSLSKQLQENEAMIECLSSLFHYNRTQQYSELAQEFFDQSQRGILGYINILDNHDVAAQFNSDSIDFIYKTQKLLRDSYENPHEFKVENLLQQLKPVLQNHGFSLEALNLEDLTNILMPLDITPKTALKMM
jgi:hypothetical protein